jgi:hypothetical protein
MVIEVQREKPQEVKRTFDVPQFLFGITSDTSLDKVLTSILSTTVSLGGL